MCYFFFFSFNIHLHRAAAAAVATEQKKWWRTKKESALMWSINIQNQVLGMPLIPTVNCKCKRHILLERFTTVFAAISMPECDLISSKWFCRSMATLCLSTHFSLTLIHLFPHFIMNGNMQCSTRQIIQYFASINAIGIIWRKMKNTRHKWKRTTF